MTYFEKVKRIVNTNADDKLLSAVVFDMNRTFDNQFTKTIRKIQKDNNLVIDTPNRKLLRKKFYYGKYFTNKTIYPIDEIDYTQEKLEETFKDCYQRIKNYNSERIIKSIKKRIDDIDNNNYSDDNMTEWLKYYDKKRKEKKYSFLALKIDQKTFEETNYDENIIINYIYKTYDSLENYRHLAIIIEDEIFNKKNESITWKLLYKAGIFAENFIQFNGDFFAFKKDKQIKTLTDFLESRKIKKAEKISQNFYEKISYGYKFEDCYVSDTQKYKILILKKIELDLSNVPCPSCNTIIQRGNSYPEVFLKSWECSNPSCPDRSKSGRGKRFDEYGTYRYFKLVENNRNNRISSELYQNFRRDVFDNNDYISFLIKEYTYSKERIMMTNCSIDHLYGRKKVSETIDELTYKENYIKEFDELPIVKLFNCILNNTDLDTGEKELNKKIEIINDNSTNYLQKLKTGQIGTAITSPPYYNAREYSQWQNLITYFVDMLINCKVVYNSLANNSYYLYNIGDIVSVDNVYVVSHMSKHRVQLGFLSSLIFETAGYSLTGNIIWDKGEVQSKRNSTVNLFSGYVKCVNCYEHILVFKKGKFDRISNSVERITPVIKINSKGENTYKHTAPYPEELVELIRPYVNEKLYILDPFLGSGTTLKWCKKNGFKGIGIELNKEYYNLCKKNI